MPHSNVSNTLYMTISSFDKLVVCQLTVFQKACLINLQYKIMPNKVQLLYFTKFLWSEIKCYQARTFLHASAIKNNHYTVFLRLMLT